MPILLHAIAVGLVAATAGVKLAAAETDRREEVLAAEITPEASATEIRLRLPDGQVLAGVLQDGPTARDFATRLPLTLTLTDYAATEKIADIPGGLTTEGAPDGFEPKAGDLAFYAPWGNLAIFHKPFRYSPKLIRLGAIEDAARLAAAGPMTVTIERAE